MLINEIENYNKPKIPNKGDFLAANNIISVISLGLLTFTLSCSSNVKLIEKDPNSPDSLLTNSNNVNNAFLTNEPNPFMPTTTISYKIKNSNNQPDSVNVSIYNIDGELVRTLINDFQESGEYQSEWDGKDENDVSVESGIYFYKLEINGDQLETKKMLLLK